MFVVEITAVLVTLIAIANVDRASSRRRPGGLGFQVQIAIWLWFTVLFATYAEAVAEARGRAQAATLRRTRSETTGPPPPGRRLARGRRLVRAAQGRHHRRRGGRDDPRRRRRHRGRRLTSTRRRSPASPRRSSRSPARTSAARSPAARRSSATGSSIRVTADPGETFLDRMIALVEGAKRQRTPNEIALAILLAGLTIVFLMATVTLRPFGALRRHTVDTVALVALLVCLIPTTIGGLLSAIGIAGHGPRRAVQRPGDERPRRRGVRRRRRHPARQDRHDHLRQPAGRRRSPPRPGVTEAEVAHGGAAVASIRDETPEGRSIVELARGAPGRARARRPATGDDAGLAALAATIAEEIPFRRETRTSGVRTERRATRSSRAPSTPSRPALDGPCRRELRRQRRPHRGSGRDAPRDPRRRPRPRRSSSSRTPSRRASPSGSPSSARWASGPS